MKFVAVGQHRSEYPEPVAFSQGALLAIGERYEGPEGWDNWFFCSTAGGIGGWVPGQIIERIDERHGRALRDYTARELDVDEGDEFSGSEQINGWMWCSRQSDGQSGWAPLSLLRAIER
ncbi:SH3 domain-containing protein [Achromobacter arsenitoxydans]|uniref:Variant SH3 domain-containing protein n=1 Tax=Achromobacter arsenitoxydans SY8 TaxID=477184 RepID=H0F2J6_9BURK|nr:SH3 domain-containing protein [Achromobacter arsenitoxydans]EHK67607.1 Variant SH3 domain-containing protein [Achromobacter arsenitoxydans SY8]